MSAEIADAPRCAEEHASFSVSRGQRAKRPRRLTEEQARALQMERKRSKDAGVRHLNIAHHAVGRMLPLLGQQLQHGQVVVHRAQCVERQARWREIVPGGFQCI